MRFIETNDTHEQCRLSSGQFRAVHLKFQETLRGFLKTQLNEQRTTKATAREKSFLIASATLSPTGASDRSPICSDAW